MPRSSRNQTPEFEQKIKQAAERKSARYVLTLYIASMNAKTRFAIENIKNICEEHLKGRYTLEVVDVRENPAVAVQEKIVATPLLIKKLPLPLRTFIGNLGDIDKILVGLNIKQREDHPHK